MLLLYPLNPSSLVLMLVASFMIWLGLTNIFLWLLGIFAFAVSVLGFSKYLFAVIKHAANGYTNPVSLNIELLRPFEEWGPYKLIITSIFIYVFSIWLVKANLTTLANMVIGFYLFLLPAFIGLLAVGDSFLHAINPLRLIRFALRAGLVYLAMLTLLALTSVLIFTLYSSNTGLFISIFITLYCLVLIFYWLGRIIYAKRDVFDYFPDQSPEREIEQLNHEIMLNRKKCMDRVFRMRRRPGIIPIILAYIETEEDRLSAHQWFHDQLMQWDNKNLAVKHGVFFIKVLREAGKTAVAEELMRVFKSIDPGFYVD